jgi:hypothetical protein
VWTSESTRSEKKEYVGKDAPLIAKTAAESNHQKAKLAHYHARRHTPPPLTNQSHWLGQDKGIGVLAAVQNEIS